MAFNSPIFLFAFLPATLLAVIFSPGRFRVWLVLLFSLIFYAWGEPRFIFVFLASALLDYLIVLRLHRAPPNSARRRLLLTAAVVSNIGLLVFLKYAAFTVEQLRVLPGFHDLAAPAVFLPLGLSFMVFEKITYIVDVHRGITPPATSVFRYLLFAFLFPKLLSGPILKYHDIAPQMDAPRINSHEIERGLERFVVGLAKKVLLADTLAEYADQVFAAVPQSLSWDQAWLGAACFGLQIYLDFSGYSDMALGLARCFGFTLNENFRQPYLAGGFIAFWQRWHISLTSWIREYLYIPLGGNRVRPLQRVANLWLCFLASGLWHGANWTFVIWGALHGLLLSADHLGLKRVWPRLPRVLSVAFTLVPVTVAWVFFRSQTIGHAFGMLAAMAGVRGTGQAVLPLPADVVTAGVIGSAVALVPLSVAGPLLSSFRLSRQVGMALLAVWMAGKVLAVGFQPFLYFRF